MGQKISISCEKKKKLPWFVTHVKLSGGMLVHKYMIVKKVKVCVFLHGVCICVCRTTVKHSSLMFKHSYHMEKEKLSGRGIAPIS